MLSLPSKRVRENGSGQERRWCWRLNEGGRELESGKWKTGRTDLDSKMLSYLYRSLLNGSQFPLNLKSKKVDVRLDKTSKWCLSYRVSSHTWLLVVKISMMFRIPGRYHWIHLHFRSAYHVGLWKPSLGWWSLVLVVIHIVSAEGVVEISCVSHSLVDFLQSCLLFRAHSELLLCVGAEKRYKKEQNVLGFGRRKTDMWK